MRLGLMLAFAFPLAAGEPYDPQVVLGRVVAKVLENNRRVPNYTCVETLTRRYFKPPATSLPRSCGVILESRGHTTPGLALTHVLTDRMRLDVAMTQRGEVFSWVGASRFEEGFIDRNAGLGPMSTGLFGSLLVLIFETDVKEFEFLGSQVVNGRSLMEYAFHVPWADSHYKVKAGKDWVYTAYSGKIRVDPETADLVGISENSAELPAATGECVSIVDLEFNLAKIGDGQFLMPKHALQHFVAPTGAEVESTTGFAGCREYRGESTVSFGDTPAPTDDRAAGAPVNPIALPPGTHFSFELTVPISADTAAAGDRFHGRLIEPMRDARQKVLAPKGTAVEGRVLRVESFPNPPAVLVGLHPEALEIRGTRVPVAAVPDWRQKTASRKRDRGRMAFDLPQPGEERSGTFRFPGEHAVVPRGFESDWTLVEPASHRHR